MSESLQISLPIKERSKWGGKRVGAGRKVTGKRKSLPHRSRHLLASRYPVHVTLKLVAGLETLRTKSKVKVIRAAMRAANAQLGCRFVHFTIQSNHLHLMCEAKSAEVLSTGVAAFEIRVARALNRLVRRRGKVFVDRFHSRVLKSPREVRHVLAYVILNSNRHAKKSGDRCDPCSSGMFFDGWRTAPLPPPKLGDEHEPVPIASAGTWLLATGWRRHGLLSPDEVPKGVAVH